MHTHTPIYMCVCVCVCVPLQFTQFAGDMVIDPAKEISVANEPKTVHDGDEEDEHELCLTMRMTLFSNAIVTRREREGERARKREERETGRE